MTGLSRIFGLIPHCRQRQAKWIRLELRFVERPRESIGIDACRESNSALGENSQLLVQRQPASTTVAREPTHRIIGRSGRIRYRDRSEAIRGRSHASSAIVSATSVHWRRVRGRTPKRYGPTMQTAARITNHAAADLSTFLPSLL